MINTSKRGSTSINKAFFRAMSGLAIAFILVLLAVSSAIFFNRILEVESDASQNQLSFIADQLDYYLDTVDNYSKTIMVDSNIQGYMLKQNSEITTLNALDQVNIKRKIGHIIQSTNFIHSVTLYSPDGERITTTEIYPFSSSLQNEYMSSDLIWTPSTKYSNTNRSVILNAHSMIRPFYNYITGTLLGYMEIAVPESTIADIYRDKASQSSNLFIVNSEGVIESSINSSFVGTDYLDFSRVIEADVDNVVFNSSTLVFSRYFKTLNWYIVSEVDIVALLKPTFAAFGLASIITLIVILVSLLVSHKLARSITRPVYSLIEHTQKIKKGDWKPLEGSASYSDINTLFVEFNDMIQAQESLKNDLISSEKQKNKISMDLLQEQINPHFLYNTLDNICAVAEVGEKETLIDLVMNLSTFYRKGLSDGSNRVTIKKELEITRAYLQIMSVRNFNKFDYEINCPRELEECFCVKFLLQPIVENSIYHGIKQINQPGYIRIDVEEDENSIIFRVSDNGIGIDEEKIRMIKEDKESGHFAVNNINRRIQLYYGSDYGLKLENLPEGGCLATIRIGKKEL